MPKANWKGVISFGLVSIPVTLISGENKSADIRFHQIDKRDNARIKYQRINANTGKKVEWDNIIKGYEYDKETTVPVPTDIVQRIAGDNARTIEIEQFINTSEFDPLMIDKPYFLIPEKKGVKGYVILREALKTADKIGIAKVIITTKEYLAAVMPYSDKALVLFLLKYDDEMRKIEDFDIPKKDLASYKISKKEIEIAKKLISSMTEKWRPEKFVDEYQATLHKWVEEEAHKIPHRAKMRSRNGHAKNDNIVDFVSLLKKSLANKVKHPKTKLKAKTKSSRKRLSA